MELPVNKIVCGDWIDILKTLPDGLVHCVVVSPPYWGQRDYGVVGQLGLEKTPEEHIEKLVLGFRELRRVLRDDGVVFLNYGDKYVGGGCGGGGKQDTNVGSLDARTAKVKNLGDGNLIGLAWRLALALQADGWYLRSDIIWAKALSFCDKYSGSTMPESVNGWRWERHKVKTGKRIKGNMRSGKYLENAQYENSGEKRGDTTLAQWEDCPGCAKCEPDGLILRKGSWRPTRAHEYLFQLTKTSSYFCDMEAVREEASMTGGGLKHNGEGDSIYHNSGFAEYKPTNRNLRDVFCINPQAYPDSHYATFPEKLVEPCIKVGTSEKGCCPKCGAQWARILDRPKPPIDNYTQSTKPKDIQPCAGGGGMGQKLQNWYEKNPTTTLGWLPTCKCGIKETVPCIVYDPFMGSGTVAAVAAKLGRNYLGSELNEDYVKNQAEYRVAEGETGITKQEQRQGQQPLFPVGKQ